ncbi:MAG TPA: L-aspartate oxidase, partial [Chloroflexota bacterium]
MQRDQSSPELLPGRSFDLIVVGSGLAGLSAALLAATYGDVLLLTKARLADSNTAFAQGGIAASLAPGDSPEIHYQDTMVAVDGLGDPRAIRALVEEGPGCVEELIALGVPFDRTDGEIAFTREGAHSQPRVLHAGGDATGARIEATMVERVRAARRVTIREDALVTDLLLDGGRVAGVRLLNGERNQLREAHGRAVLLATGGAGQLFAHTTNPVVATGDGIAAAWRAGALLADLEFYQFHPTALALPGAPRFLISEAVRGEGGILRNRAGERFMLRYDPRAELAPRDVVARSIVFEMQRTGDPSAYLDVRQLGASHVRARFPTISRVCSEFGIDIGHDLIPVAPAAHYLMGGIRTDLWGQTSLPGLYASGECACSGVHGANRLASNSLLETLVFSVRAVQQHFGRRQPEAADPWQPAVAEELLPPKILVIAADLMPPPTTSLTRETLQARMW